MKNKSRQTAGENLWYKDAVVYQLNSKSFFDQNNDGHGDLLGLTEKLWYLDDLGISALWLPPIFPLGFKDEGYGIANFTEIDPAYGSIADLKKLLREAHRLGIRVILELPIDHTSDLHDWFQKAKKPKTPGWQDFFVWKSDATKTNEIKSSKKNQDISHWSWDQDTKKYYLHAFNPHTPKLNYQNPKVKRAIQDVLCFWFDLGVDGLRLDGLSSLHTGENDPEKNLQETHHFLQDLRKFIDFKYKNKVLLSGAIPSQDEARGYFGDGKNECHLGFHLPLMRALLMSVRFEDRLSILETLKKSPAIPDSCQWLTFLRNPSESGNQLLSNDISQIFSRVIQEPDLQTYLDPKRRLAPLLGNDRRQIELLNGLLFSLPGTPVIYFGDEIGMGDNIFLGEKESITTPFQWNADRNAGFSKTNPHRLFLPVIIEPEYHYGAINVETQQNNPNSLLWWMKALIAKRKSYDVLSRGRLHLLEPENSKVLTFLREYNEELILVVANLSKKAQCVEIDLSKYNGYVPTEIFGQVEFPPIGELPYFVTLGPYSFYWFALQKRTAGDTSRPMLMKQTRKPLEIEGEPITALELNDIKKEVEKDLCSYLPRMRWFVQKLRKPLRCDIEETIILQLPGKAKKFALLIVEVSYEDIDPEKYLVTVGYAEGERTSWIRASNEKAIICENLKRIVSFQDGVFYDASIEAEFFQDLLEFILGKKKQIATSGNLLAEIFRQLKQKWVVAQPKPNFRGFEQNNTAIYYDKEFFFKLYRKLDQGENPELEILKELNSRKRRFQMPELIGALTYHRGKEQYTFGILETYIDGTGDAWKYTTEALTQYSQKVLAKQWEIEDQIADTKKPFYLGGGKTPSPLLLEAMDYYLGIAGLLGQRTAELHLALGEGKVSAFMADDFSDHQTKMCQSIKGLAKFTLARLREAESRLPPRLATLAKIVLEAERDLLGKISALQSLKIHAKNLRCHGNLHLGQVLCTGNDFVILDFEGEPALSLKKRKEKCPPFRDVAEMLRSFDYVVHNFLKQNYVREEDKEKLRPWLGKWAFWVKKEYYEKYCDKMEKSKFLPKRDENRQKLLEVLLLERMLEEINIELDLRPEWAELPLNGLLELVGEEGE